MDFADLGLLPELLQAVSEQGYQTPSPIQAEAIPHVLDRRDVMAAAQTGTGKTASFTLPMLHHLATKASANKKSSRSNQVRSLILTPTRELAAQVADNVVAYSKHLNIKSVVVFGGVKINPQMMKLRGGADVLIATPGRLLDLYNQNALKFDQLETLVLDEADRMLDMGFLRDIKKILALLPKHRQTLLFSATFSDDIRTLAKGLVNDPIEVSVAPPNTTAKTVKQWISSVDKGQKPAALIQLIKTNQWQQVLVFTRTKHGANRLTEKLNKAGITAAAIHGNKSQAARTKALANFKSNEIRILVATDIAARGIDIEQLPQVVNFELPNTAEDYVHRIGRTGRAGEDGEAISLVSADEFQQLKDIERLIKEVLPRVEIKGFNASNAVPESKLDTRPIKAKKPKKPKKPRQNHQDGQRSVGSHQAEKKQKKRPSSSNRSETSNKQEKTQGNQPSRSTPKKRPAKPSNRSNNDNPWGNR